MRYVRSRVSKLNRRTRTFPLRQLPLELQAVAQSLDGRHASVEWSYTFPATRDEVRGQYALHVEQDAGQRLDELSVPASLERAALLYAVSEALYNGHQHSDLKRRIVVRFRVSWHPGVDWRCVTVSVRSRLRPGQRVGFTEPAGTLFLRRRGNGLGIARDASDDAHVIIRNGDAYQIVMRKFFPLPARQAMA